MKKYMKFAALLVIITALLCGCATELDAVATTAAPETTMVAEATAAPETTAAPVETTPLSTEPEEKPFPQTDLMCLPGLKWGMGKEEVASALGMPAEDIVGKGYIQYFDGMEVLGYPAEKVIVLFNGGEPRLSRVAVYFPDDTDMEAVKQQLKQLYGEPAGQMTQYSIGGITYNSSKETLEEHLAKLPEHIPSALWEGDEHNLYWVADQTLADQFEQEEMENWIASYPEIYHPYFREYADMQPVGFVYLSDNYGNDILESDEYRNLLLFYGSDFADTAQDIRR